MGIDIKNVTLLNIVNGFQNIFNYVDHRLVNHGERVAYLMLKMLEEKGTYTKEELINLTALTTFHDVGAYKTDNIDSIVQFEAKKEKCIQHSVYGYLYVKYFSPFAHMANLIYYHHSYYKDVKHLQDKYISEAMVLQLADRVDILLSSSDDIDLSRLYNYSDIIFKKEDIDLLIKINKEQNILHKLKTGKYRDEIYALWNSVVLTQEEVSDSLEMMVFILDFRNVCTVNHSITVAALTKLLCDKITLDEEEKIIIQISAILHDIGKVTTPLSILNKPGKLSHDEMEIMKQHVVATKNILKNLGFNKLSNVAGSHHEKIDGTGYPDGLKGDELSTEIRILCVADIVGALIGARSYKDAFPKEQVIEIISEMANKNKIDREISNLVINDYDEIMEKLREETIEFYHKEKTILKEYEEIMNSVGLNEEKRLILALPM